MTNAERQARYRARLKARASVEALGDRARSAVADATAAIWTFFNRPGPTGEPWEDVEGCATLEDYRARLAAEAGALVGVCRDLAAYNVGLTPEEVKAIGVVLEIADALDLRGGKSPGR